MTAETKVTADTADTTTGTRDTADTTVTVAETTKIQNRYSGHNHGHHSDNSGDTIVTAGIRVSARVSVQSVPTSPDTSESSDTRLATVLQ